MVSITIDDTRTAQLRRISASTLTENTSPLATFSISDPSQTQTSGSIFAYRPSYADINYVNAQHGLTFRRECKGDHPASLRYLGTQPYILYCSKMNEQYTLSPEHELWQVKKPQHHHDPMPPPPQALAKQQLEKPIAQGTCLNEAGHHSILFNQLKKHSADWRNIGRCLGFLPSHLDVIEAKPLLLKTAPNSWLEALLVQWLRSGEAKLEKLRDALWEAGLGQTASDLHI